MCAGGEPSSIAGGSPHGGEQPPHPYPLPLQGERASLCLWSPRQLIILFALIAAVYALLVPPFELPDEPDHLAYVNFLAERVELPNQYVAERAVLREGHQPPLYYALCALLVRATQPDARIDVHPVPHRPPDPDAPEQIPIFRHVDMPIFPTEADRAGFYLLRLLSVLMATLNVAVAFRFFERVLPMMPADQNGGLPVAVAPVALLLLIGLPQFAFISGGITNDNLANLLATLCLYGFIRLIEKKDAMPAPLWLHAGVGVALGLGLLTKKSLLVLLIGWLLLMGWLLWRVHGSRRQVLMGGALTLSLVALLSGWWFIRNAMLYGDPLGEEMERRTLTALVQERSLFSRYFLISFWRVTLFSAIGIFGWMNVRLPFWVYGLGVLTVLLGLLGLARGWRQAPISVRWCLVWALLGVAGLVWYNLTYTQPQGRLLFPVLPAGLALIACGLTRWFAPSRLLAVLTVLALLLHLISWWSLYAFYYPPERYPLLHPSRAGILLQR